MSREKSEKVCITFRLSEEEHEKLKQYSSACGYKMSRPNVQKILYKNVQLVCLS